MVRSHLLYPIELRGLRGVILLRKIWSSASASSATPANRMLYFPLRFFAHRNFCAIEILRLAAADIFHPLRRPRRGPGLPCPFNAPIAAVIACNSRVAASCLASASFAALRSTFRMFIQKPSHLTIPQTTPRPRCPKAASIFTRTICERFLGDTKCSAAVVAAL